MKTRVVEITQEGMCFLCNEHLKHLHSPEHRFIFVYGSLKKGECNHFIILGSSYFGKVLLKDYKLINWNHNMAFSIPMAVPKDSHYLIGELYMVPNAIFNQVDTLELSAGYRRNCRGNVYYWESARDV